MLLEGKTALITGAGRGIGKAIAILFAEQGCDVAVAARSSEEIEAVAEEARALEQSALALPCDVTDFTQVTASVDTALQHFGHLDILVNNAGYACFKPTMELSVSEWQQTLDVNLTGPFMYTKAVLPSMMARQSGRIINISSVAGLKPILNQSVYCASKYGLNGFSKALALEMREHGISVHAVCPGAVDTQLAQDAMPERDKSDWMQPSDVAQACLYLASLRAGVTVDELSVRRFASTPIGR